MSRLNAAFDPAAPSSGLLARTTPLASCGLRGAARAESNPVDERSAWRALRAAASARYRSAGRFASEAAAGKLRFDPVFRHLLAHGLIAAQDRLLDIGCGRGLLLSLLGVAEEAAAAGHWPPAWGAPPVGVRMTGIDRMPRDAALARTALGDRAEVICGDMRATTFPPSDVVVMLDVLHYVDIDEQNRLLARVRQALPPGGRLLLRVGDAGRAAGFRYSRWVDRIVLMTRGQRRLPMVGRPIAAWQRQLESLGFRVETRPMSRGTPFANLLLLARVDPAVDPCGAPAP